MELASDGGAPKLVDDVMEVSIEGGGCGWWITVWIESSLPEAQCSMSRGEDVSPNDANEVRRGSVEESNESDTTCSRLVAGDNISNKQRLVADR